MRPKTIILLLAIAVYFICCAWIAFGKPWSLRQSSSTKSSSDYILGVNAALDATLLVGSDMRARGKHPTWAEIDREVCRRLKIKRDLWYVEVAKR